MMVTDTRAQAAKYYDLNPDIPADVPFYLGLIPSPEAQVLELGCGTGRVLVPLAEECGYIHGLDLSEAMVTECRRKLQIAGLAATKVQVEVQDITRLCRKVKMETSDLVTFCYLCSQGIELLCRRL